MINSIPEVFRKEAVESLFSTSTLEKSWPIWKTKISATLGDSFDETDVINLGDHLSEIFASTGGAGRGQGLLSGGGIAWESLVCWYINLCTIGSRTAAFRKMSLVPKPIQDAITVNYGNFACNTESDITVVVFPDTADFNEDIEDLIKRKPNPIKIANNGKLDMDMANRLCYEHFERFEIGIIQCKTNWNDNAQIPMLWDMIYSANGFRGRNITIGRDGYNIHNTQNFTYSFVTVPSNTRTKHNPNSVAVKRAANLSGGNYWGRPTEQNVARSVKELFTNNYYTGFRKSIRTDIKNSLRYLEGDLAYFRLFDF